MAYDDSNQDLIPKSLGKLRSCIGCGFLQNSEWWDVQDCPNCTWKDNNTADKFFDRYENYTSASYSGIISLFQPKKSWCAQWQRYHTNVAGMYALYNDGEVNKFIIEHLEAIQHPLPEWVERAKNNYEDY